MSNVSYPVLPLTITVTGAVTAYRFVGTDKATAAAAANTLGVAQWDGVADDDVTIDTLGAVPVEVGAAVAEGDLLETDANGCAVTQSAGVGVARALSSATASGQRVLAMLIPN